MYSAVFRTENYDKQELRKSCLPRYKTHYNAVNKFCILLKYATCSELVAFSMNNLPRNLHKTSPNADAKG